LHLSEAYAQPDSEPQLWQATTKGGSESRVAAPAPEVCCGAANAAQRKSYDLSGYVLRHSNAASTKNASLSVARSIERGCFVSEGNCLVCCLLQSPLATIAVANGQVMYEAALATEGRHAWQVVTTSQRPLTFGVLWQPTIHTLRKDRLV